MKDNEPLNLLKIYVNYSQFKVKTSAWSIKLVRASREIKIKVRHLLRANLLICRPLLPCTCIYGRERTFTDVMQTIERAQTQLECGPNFNCHCVRCESQNEKRLLYYIKIC